MLDDGLQLDGLFVRPSRPLLAIISIHWRPYLLLVGMHAWLANGPQYRWYSACSMQHLT